MQTIRPFVPSPSPERTINIPDSESLEMVDAFAVSILEGNTEELTYELYAEHQTELSMVAPATAWALNGLWRSVSDANGKPCLSIVDAVRSLAEVRKRDQYLKALEAERNAEANAKTEANAAKLAAKETSKREYQLKLDHYARRRVVIAERKRALAELRIQARAAIAQAEQDCKAFAQQWRDHLAQQSAEIKENESIPADDWTEDAQ